MRSKNDETIANSFRLYIPPVQFFPSRCWIHSCVFFSRKTPETLWKDIGGLNVAEALKKSGSTSLFSSFIISYLANLAFFCVFLSLKPLLLTKKKSNERKREEGCFHLLSLPKYRTHSTNTSIPNEHVFFDFNFSDHVICCNS